MQLIGVDTGGTFTDTVLITSEGTVGVGKSPSTPGSLERGVLDSISAAARSLGTTIENVLATTDFVAHGTTAGLNALLTGDGARVGLITTKGFEATVPMARANTVRGIDERYKTEAVHWDKPALLMSRKRIRGVLERIDADGNVVCPLDEDQAIEAISELKAIGVDAIGISLLWAHLNPDHEIRLRGLVRSVMPDISITLSSELAPRIGEYERSITVVLNAYVAPLMAAYITNLEDALRGLGFSGTFLLTKNSGGIQRARSLVERPIETLNSGPVGGLVATAEVGRQLGHVNIVATDVGGTSFDVGLVVAGRPKLAPRPMIGRYDIATPVVDIASIGTGGGSIAWLDPEMGSLRVGPQSAGAMPGPVCYERGGVHPTVTDAAVVLGYLEKIGDLSLNPKAASKAITHSIAEPLAMDVHQAAEGILAVASAQMADLVRRATLMRGIDPAGFVLYAYGGAAPQYVGRYAPQIGVEAAYVPGLASIFSAFGAVSSDFRASATRDIEPAPFSRAGDLALGILGQLEEQARSELGEHDSGVSISRKVGLRFFRQINEIQIEIGPDVGDADLVDSAISTFRSEYERLVGRGTAASSADVELVNLTVEAVLSLASPEVGTKAERAQGVQVGSRKAWFRGQFVECPVYDVEHLAAGATVEGPAFVDLPTTTLVVYDDQSATIDALGHIRLDLGDAPR
ncbi:MAG: hydantoinase/oxoprolinase family protein [Acidimicrobiales bacterium]